MASDEIRMTLLHLYQRKQATSERARNGSQRRDETKRTSPGETGFVGGGVVGTRGWDRQAAEV